MKSFFTHPLTLRVISVVIVFSFWEYLGRIPISPAFPTFLETMAALWEMITDGSMVAVYPATFQPLLIGLFISSFFGIACGIFMGLNHRAEWFGAPVFIVLQSPTLAALIPMHTLAYGIGLTTTVLTGCIMSMPVIVLNAYSAVRHTPVSMIEMGESYL